MYKITINSWGGVKIDLMTDLTYEEAVDICDGYGWEWSSEFGGYIWDLEIEEDGEIIGI